MEGDLADRLLQADRALRQLRVEAFTALRGALLGCGCDDCRQIRRALEQGTTAYVTPYTLAEGLRHNTEQGGNR